MSGLESQATEDHYLIVGDLPRMIHTPPTPDERDRITKGFQKFLERRREEAKSAVDQID